ncbi:hypothetical protein FGO68_gene3433 [Halteria grandinella]|uniref:Protein kinase domain-containing protein n=1 Tax=Halteria grandinella TaxID=5974 RepID=A0A8J8T7K5_HALGN|nr:hypothetical protein FGO68_gene3433 [Halteria grandinella]
MQAVRIFVNWAGRFHGGSEGVSIRMREPGNLSRKSGVLGGRSAMSEPSQKLETDYRQIEQLCQGSFGEAYLVESIKSNKQYALMIVSTKDIVPQSHRMTAPSFLQSTAHPFIIGYIEDFPSTQIGKHCIILEYADGCHLRKKMVSMGNQITEDVAITWLAQVCLGLAEMHSKGLLHHDIKPENILIVDEVAKLGNFGTNKKISSGLKFGTYQYFSPESGDTTKIQGEADIWSLGIVLFEMCTGGQFPFQYDFEQGNLQDYLNKLPFLELRQMPEHLSTECKTLIMHMLEKSPQSRPNVMKVLQHTIIKEKIRQIIEDKFLGEEIALRIREQIITLETQIPEKSSFEEQKQLQPSSASKQSTVISSINLQQLADSFEQQLALQSEESKQCLPTLESIKFSRVAIDNFLNMIREKGHKKLVEASLQLGLTLNLLNCNQTKEAMLLEFEGNEFFEKGGTYYGECVEGLRDGWGLLQCIHKEGDQCLFECEWTQGVPVKGKSMLIWEEQWHYYEGQFDARMLRTGIGRREGEDGRTYEGEWRDGQKNGQGKETFADGRTYEGEFKDDKKCGYGYGKYICEDGRVYEGEFKNGKQNGQGKMTQADCETYEGGWKEGNRHGKGKVVYPNGEAYEGEWKDDMLNGKGKYTWADGRIYEGEFKDDLYEGQGKITYPDGYAYEGQWKDDKRHGIGRVSLADGQTYEGEWKENKYHGKGKYTWPDGRIYEGKWKDDKLHGTGRITFSNGDYQEGQYEGNQIGVHKHFSKEGKLIKLITYEDGEVVKEEEVKKVQLQKS